MSAGEKKALPIELAAKMVEEYSRFMQEVTRITFDYMLSLQKVWVESISRMAEPFGVAVKPLELSAELYRAWADANIKLISSWLEAARKSFEAIFRP
ncbi:MAG: hypothetical protein N3E48_00150 [Candidatus Bathyarchaeota archaeon]|nr:hypothetical protein [Candidatus Bathyarchaeota archaeon]